LDERRFFSVATSMHANFPPRFYPIIDTAVLARTEFSPIQVAEEAASAGVKIIQYRHKDNWAQANFDDAKAIDAICREAAILFVVNDRADYAHLLGVGLHIGQEDLPPVAARKVVANAVIGFSTHNALQLRRANEEPADYLSLGPIFSTQSKKRPDPVVGIDGLKALRVLTTKPLVAIGGITLENAPAVLAAGADSVAVISGFLPGGSNLTELRELFDKWLHITSA
jgi:thiamine-phosphate pyrophosphorylase